MRERSKLKQLEPNSSNWFYKRDRFIDEYSGGSTMGRSFGGGYVVESHYGEFAVDREKEGELMAFFPDKGVMCGYLPTGELAFAAFDVAGLLKNLDEEDLSSMANGGETLADLISGLHEKGEILFLTVFPLIDSIRLKVMKGSETKEEVIVENAELGSGRLARFTLDGHTLAYNVESTADELVVGIGEDNGKRMTLRSVYISHRVEVDNNLGKLGSAGLKNLADKIILND